jgi:hypothetical protein
MSDLILVLTLLGAIGGLLWLNANRHDPDRLQQVNSKASRFKGLAGVEKALLLAAGLMGSLFAYGIFAPIHPLLGYLVGAAVIAFNFAEGFLIRLSLASWRYDFKAISMLAALGVLIVMGYSLTAGSSVIETYLAKNQDLQLAAQYEIKASRDQIENAKAGILKAQMEARKQDPYSYLSNPDIAQAQMNAAAISAQENQRIAQVLKDKTPEFKAAFGMSRDAVAFLVALALEFSILGIVIFTELLGKPTPLPALVKFANKQLDWNVNPNQLNHLHVEKSPSPETIALPQDSPTITLAPAKIIPNPVPIPVAVPNPVPTLAPLPPRAHGTQGYPSTQGTHGYAGLNDANLAPSAKQDELFDSWVRKLKSGDLKPSASDTRAFINDHRLANGIKLISGLADSWLNRAENIGVLALNPVQKNGLPKYILAGEKGSAVNLDKVA